MENNITWLMHVQFYYSLFHTVFYIGIYVKLEISHHDVTAYCG